MKPNFEEMSNQELKAYALAHRGDEDIEALRILFSRRSPDSEAILFHPPKTKEEEQQQFELFKQIVEKIEGKKDSNNLDEKELQKEQEMKARLRLEIERELEAEIRQKLEKEIEAKVRQKIERQKDQNSQS